MRICLRKVIDLSHIKRHSRKAIEILSAALEHPQVASLPRQRQKSDLYLFQCQLDWFSDIWRPCQFCGAIKLGIGNHGQTAAPRSAFGIDCHSEEIDLTTNLFSVLMRFSEGN
jgi:hypothetical protein